MKLLNVGDNDQPVNWQNVENQNIEDGYKQAVKQQSAARHQYTVFSQKLKPYEKHIITQWNGEFQSPVSHKIKYGYTWWGLPVGTPNGDQLWKAIKFYVARVNQARKMESKYARIAAKLKKAARTERFNELKYKTTIQTIPSSEVPRRIYYAPGEGKYFNNPYWNRENVISRYAGQVGHFPEYTPTERNMLVELDQTLIRNGLAGLEKMYGSTIKSGRWANNHFVVFGANDKFIWKHVHGNLCYVDGKKVSISWLTNPKEVEFQQKIFEPLKQKATNV